MSSILKGATDSFNAAEERGRDFAEKLAKNHLQESQAKMKVYYDRTKSKTRTPFKNGSIVWVFYPAKTKGAGKLRHQWIGPFRVININVGFDNILVEDTQSKRQLLVHVSFLRPFATRSEDLDSVAANLGHALAELGPNDYIDDQWIDRDDEGHIIIERRRKRNRIGRYECQIKVKYHDDTEKWLTVVENEE